jgi:hypothetical protein
MAKYQRVSPRFWQDPKVRRWGDQQKLLGQYFLTCPHRTTEGLFWLPRGYVAQDLGWGIDTVFAVLASLIEAGFVAYDDASETVFLCKALKYEAPAGPKQIQGAITRLADVPPTPLFAQLRDAAAKYAPEFCKALDGALEHGELRHHRGPTDTPPKGYPNRTDSSSSSSSSNSSSSSVPPTAGRSLGTEHSHTPTALVVVSDPEPPDPLEPPETAQTVLAAYIDWRQDQGINGFDRRTKGQLAKHLGQAFDGGHTPEAVKQGLLNWHHGEQHPATLPSYIDAAARGGRSRPVTRQERGRAQLVETDEALERWAASREGGGGRGRTRVEGPG